MPGHIKKYHIHQVDWSRKLIHSFSHSQIVKKKLFLKT